MAVDGPVALVLGEPSSLSSYLQRVHMSGD
jgi:hypothetical protein